MPETIKVDLSEFKIEPSPMWALSRMKGGDGYDTMDDAREHRWIAVPSWGRDGWDLLEWPYYVAYVRNTQAGFELATNCEGDVEVWRFPNREAREKAIDDLAFWNWQIKGNDWVAGIEPDQRPDHLRGPYNVDRA